MVHAEAQDSHGDEGLQVNAFHRIPKAVERAVDYVVARRWLLNLSQLALALVIAGFLYGAWIMRVR